MEFINVKLSDIGEVVGGATPSTKNPDNYDGNIAWITPKDLAGYNKVYISKGERNITEMGFKSCSTKILPKNSVLFSSRAPIGYVAISENDLCTNQGFKSIIPNNKIDYKFLYYLLKHNKNYIASKGSGSTFKEVSGSVMKGIELSIPKNINDQKKISKILFDIDKKIELNNEINNNLEEQLRLFFEEEILKKLNNENTYECSLYDQFDVIDNRGKTPPLVEYSKYPIIDVKVLSGTERVINYNNCLKYVSKETYDTFFRSGHPKLYDTLLSTVGSLAELKIYLENIGTIAQNVVALRPKNDYPLFMYQYILSLKRRLTSYDIGSVQPSIKVTQFMKEIIKIPKDKDLIYKFENLANANTFKMKNLMMENRYLEQLRDTLLPKLMNSEINLDNVEI